MDNPRTVQIVLLSAISIPLIVTGTVFNVPVLWIFGCAFVALTTWFIYRLGYSPVRLVLHALILMVLPAVAHLYLTVGI